jgi:hypothetical protein
LLRKGHRQRRASPAGRFVKSGRSGGIRAKGKKTPVRTHDKLGTGGEIGTDFVKEQTRFLPIVLGLVRNDETRSAGIFHKIVVYLSEIVAFCFVENKISRRRNRSRRFLREHARLLERTRSHA